MKAVNIKGSEELFTELCREEIAQMGWGPKENVTLAFGKLDTFLGCPE